jgi:hypothetical protein
MLAGSPSSPRNIAINRWLKSLDNAGWQIFMPEIADYEVRRELLCRCDLQCQSHYPVCSRRSMEQHSAMSVIGSKGKFSAPEDLLQISGIGEKKFARMQPFVKVR